MKLCVKVGKFVPNASVKSKCSLRISELRKAFRVQIYCTVKPILATHSIDQHKEICALFTAVSQT